MSDTSQTGIVTESTLLADGLLKIRSIIELQQGSSISVESSWKQIPEKSSFEMTETSVHFGNMVFSLPRASTLLAHSYFVSKEQVKSREKLSITDTRNQPRRKKQKRVYMVTRHDGVEVFLDPLSAAFWGGNRRLVKDVSVNTAAFVLKTDGKSVIESATSTSAQTWELIDAVLSIISLATQLNTRIEEMDISLEELTTKKSVIQNSH
ncbi:MAG: hypothetical protein ACFFCX_02905 [Candidatus Sifarchaeia archaeon]